MSQRGIFFCLSCWLLLFPNLALRAFWGPEFPENKMVDLRDLWLKINLFNELTKIATFSSNWHLIKILGNSWKVELCFQIVSFLMVFIFCLKFRFFRQINIFRLMINSTYSRVIRASLINHRQRINIQRKHEFSVPKRRKIPCKVAWKCKQNFPMSHLTQRVISKQIIQNSLILVWNNVSISLLSLKNNFT